MEKLAWQRTCQRALVLLSVLSGQEPVDAESLTSGDHLFYVGIVNAPGDTKLAPFFPLPRGLKMQFSKLASSGIFSCHIFSYYYFFGRIPVVTQTLRKESVLKNIAL